MKKIIAILLLFSINSYADCDWKTGITPGPNKTFIYSEACHQAVGVLVQANADLNKAIQLKDLALTNADARTQLWMKTTDDQLDKINKIENDQKRNDFLYFALGIGAAIGVGFATARLVGK